MAIDIWFLYYQTNTNIRLFYFSPFRFSEPETPSRLQPSFSVSHQMLTHQPENVSRLLESSHISEGHSPPLTATNLTVVDPLRTAEPSPHPASLCDSSLVNQNLQKAQNPDNSKTNSSLSRTNVSKTQIHRPFSPTWWWSFV